ncbi:putative oxidoreductase [Pseudomonas benzenivorans]|nr:DoxX family protein [Pseudomonas benzenivorans]SDH29284.1 putative oxidoreductase [Pseudomonas benzenivorans]
MNAFQSPLILAGRMLLALLFLLAGIDKLADIAGTAGYIASVGLPAATPLAVLSGVFEVLAALALAVGWQARWAALSLALFTLLTNLLFHNFWALPADQVYMAQIKFMKNLSIVGGMLVVAALGAGPLSLDARRAN